MEILSSSFYILHSYEDLIHYIFIIVSFIISEFNEMQFECTDIRPSKQCHFEIQVCLIVKKEQSDTLPSVKIQLLHIFNGQWSLAGALHSPFALSLIQSTNPYYYESWILCVHSNQLHERGPMHTAKHAWDLPKITENYHSRMLETQKEIVVKLSKAETHSTICC